MTPPPLFNCTEQQLLILKELHGSFCLEGGFCKVIPPERVFCQCPTGWTGDVCDEPDFVPMASFGSGLGAIAGPIALVALLLLALAGVFTLFICLALRRRQRRRSRRQATIGAADEANAALNAKEASAERTETA